VDSSALIREYIGESIDVKRKILSDIELLDMINHSADIIFKTLSGGGRIFLAGNGGSAADSQHIAAEFVSRFNFDRPGLAAIALTTDTSILTAVGNDYGFDLLFSRQIEALTSKKDVYIAFTTSGKSKNILSSLHTAKELGLNPIVMCGNREFDNRLASIVLKIPSDKTSLIQEALIMVGHLLCNIVERRLFKGRA